MSEAVQPPVLATVDAALNFTAATLMTAGYVAIRRNNVFWHRALMLGAFAVSVVFLACYLYYHATHEPVRFQRTGFVRVVYLSILGTHTVLAAVTVPLVLIALWHAFRGQYRNHRRIARITLPIWWYVSVTGVLVYWMLYHL